MPAALVTLLLIGLLVLALRRTGGPSRAAVGLTSAWTNTAGFVVGVSVVAVPAAVVFGAATALRWVSWSLIDGRTLALFLTSNAAIALLIEAIPEELALRGYTYAGLRMRYGMDVAAAWTTFVFVLVVLALGLVIGVVDTVAESDPGAVLDPLFGDDIVTYLSFIVLIGLLLAYARESTPTRTIWPVWALT